METATTIENPQKSSSLMKRCLRTLHLAEAAFRIREFFYQLLRIDGIRTMVAGIRYFTFVIILRRFKTLNVETGNVNSNAVSHNRRNIMRTVGGFSVTRSNFLLHPLSGMQMSKSAPVLSIGPRTEGEILNLMGLGFRNIRAIDLMTYSPWIDLGDMHALPYKNDEFAAVIMGWVLTYSSNKRQAALEALRVVRNGGIIAVGSASSRIGEEPLLRENSTPSGIKQWNPTWTELLDCFKPHIDHIYYAHNHPVLGGKQRDLMAIFSVRK